MADRRAPDGGYDRHGPKAQYRRDVWAEFRRHIGPQRAEANALLMPSSEGVEIDVAERNGFRLNRLHVCDRNTAIAATLRRRYPKLAGAYGGNVSSAARRLAERDIKLHVVNLDLCGYFGAQMLQEIHGVAWSGCLVDDAIVAVTFFRGREQGTFNHALQFDRRLHALHPEKFGHAEVWGGPRVVELSLPFFWRNYDCTTALPMSPDGHLPPLDRGIRLLRYGEYQSTSPMAYFIVRLAKQPRRADAHLQAQRWADRVFS